MKHLREANGLTVFGISFAEAYNCGWLDHRYHIRVTAGGKTLRVDQALKRGENRHGLHKKAPVIVNCKVFEDPPSA
jgi:hypothetical protein